MTSSRNHSPQSRPSPRSSDEAAVGVIARGREQAAQLSTASAVLQRSLERLANLSDVRLLVSEVLTSIIEVAGADGGALLRYEPSTRNLVLQSYVLDGLVLDIANNERLAQKQEKMPAESFPHWKDILGATDTFFAYNDCGVHPALPEVVYTDVPMNSAGLVLRRGDTIIGLLILVYHLSEELPAERILATRTLTRYAALVLELAWLADESREAAVIRAQAKAAEERAAELASANAALSRSIEMLASFEDLPRFTSQILHEAIRASGADNGSVSLFDEVPDTLRRLAVWIDGEAVDLLRKRQPSSRNRLRSGRRLGTYWARPEPGSGSTGKRRTLAHRSCETHRRRYARSHSGRVIVSLRCYRWSCTATPSAS